MTQQLITPDLLLELGFTKNFPGYKYFLDFGVDGDLYLAWFVASQELELEVGGIDSCRTKLYHIKYIHQLQNLYYSLTGEELKYVN
jgi:hypothetical protein